MVALMGYVICGGCGEFIAEEDLIVKDNWSHSNYIGFGGYYNEKTLECPHCGYEDNVFEDASECGLCGEPIADGEYCEDCRLQLFGMMDEYFVNIAKKWGADDDAVSDAMAYYLEHSA